MQYYLEELKNPNFNIKLKVQSFFLKIQGDLLAFYQIFSGFPRKDSQLHSMLQDVYVKSEDQHLNDPPQQSQQRPLPLDRVRYQDVRYEIFWFS